MSEVSILTQIQKDEELFSTFPEVERVNLVRELRSSVQIAASYKLINDRELYNSSFTTFHNNVRFHR